MSARRRRDERGAIAILAAVLAVVLVGIVAFVTDYGLAYANKRLLQNGVDASVLSAAQTINETAPPQASCADMLSHTAAARSEAEAIFRENAPAAGAALQPGGAGFTVDCVDGLGMVVTATGYQDSPAFFGGVFGISRVPIAQSAKAVVAVAGEVRGLRPFGVCNLDARSVIDFPDDAKTLSFSKGSEGCGTGSGNWGLLDLDGFKGGGNNDIKDRIEFGFEGKIPDLTNVQSETGNFGGGLTDAMNAILGKHIPLPVFDKVNGGSGSNLTYNVVGYLVVEICAYDFGGSSAGSHLCHDPVEWAASTAAVAAGGGKGKGGKGGSGSGGGGSTTNYLQVRHVKYVPVGEANLDCALGDGLCDFGTRVVKLAD